MDARSQRALARRNRRDILEEREQVPLCIRIPGARGRGGPSAAEVPAAIEPRMWLNMVNVKPQETREQ